ncbi:mitotic checkpoint serine/threonine-protein kinase BUB1 beta-like [Cimex lectularius]|uniref:BUB1 N-terminal domain-containing protein n=1 Tax=Cimex lectularius TaxID=79782 RepID=A0A8I6SUY7_CIMLE|nr:mitotic checkpoint serine/threonine-protein kinase BUB1 beta-like [Cimex lectularius]XP_024085966.1 mitotic checkpoint serine/threonine-protein kinase BUB1 beta-like [Cimex lectularius]
MDADILDLCKENIQPLKQGRKANHLGLALQAQNDSELKERLDRERDQHELEIITYDGDDPLEPRYNYVHWLEQTYPKHGKESNLVPILEDTIMLFKDDDRYKQDPRFIGLIIKYIESQENDIELFQMVYGQGLGTMCSMFYKAWADALDRNMDVKRADQIYQLGLSTHAEPYDILQNAHVQFQMSVGRRMMGGELPCPEKQVSAETSERQRQVLGKLKKVTSMRTSSTAPGKFSVLSSSNKIKKDNATFSVYKEDEIGETLFGSNSKQKLNIVNSELTHKENTLKPGPWNQGLKKKAPVLSTPVPVPSTPTFEVCVDSDEDLTPPKPPSSNPTPASSKVLKLRKAEIQPNPMMLFKSPYPGAKGNLPKFEVFTGGREFCFEELRWAYYKKQIEIKLDNKETPLKKMTAVTPCRSAMTPQLYTPQDSPWTGNDMPIRKGRVLKPLVKPLFMPLPEEENGEEENLTK